MQPEQSQPRFPYTPAGVICDDDEAHICVLGEEGWPHYTSVPLDDPAQWRRALATLADPNTPTLGKHRRPNLRRPIWLGVEMEPDAGPSSRLLALVLLPKGRLSFLPRQEIADYAGRIGGSLDCRFDHAELIANYVLRNQPACEDDFLLEAGCAAGLACARRLARG